MSARECAFIVCRDPKGELTRGHSACGSKSSVSLSVRCNSGCTPIAIVHNHPSQNPRPSEADLHAAGHHKIAVCVKTNGGVHCYRPR